MDCPENAGRWLIGPSQTRQTTAVRLGAGCEIVEVVPGLLDIQDAQDLLFEPETILRFIDAVEPRAGCERLVNAVARGMVGWCEAGDRDAAGPTKVKKLDVFIVIQ
jgi:hypothetical protein